MSPPKGDSRQQFWRSRIEQDRKPQRFIPWPQYLFWADRSSADHEAAPRDCLSAAGLGNKTPPWLIYSAEDKFNRSAKQEIRQCSPRRRSLLPPPSSSAPLPRLWRVIPVKTTGIVTSLRAAWRRSIRGLANRPMPAALTATPRCRRRSSVPRARKTRAASSSYAILGRRRAPGTPRGF